MVNTNAIIIRQTATTELTALDLGAQLSGDAPDAQAAILLAFARDVMGWDSLPRKSWPIQCRMICDELTNEECRDIAGVLDSLMEHLRGVPRERAEEHSP